VSNFYENVYRVTRAIPCGKVATYGQIAAILGSVRASRMVGVALSHAPHDDIPWQRVVNRVGMISIENLTVPKIEQVHRLLKEGVQITQHDGNYFVDIKQYLISPEVLKHALE
jgi:methylated-DNA-protein-cysteine methyltransferase-like protein